MNKEKQRIAIAKACGKTKHLWSESPGDVPCIGFIPQCDRCMIRADERGANDPCLMVELPDYLNDLNAMHEAVVSKWDDDNFWYGYISELEKITGQDLAKRTRILLHATAAQRAEAFLRTLGLWKEEEKQ